MEDTLRLFFFIISAFGFSIFLSVCVFLIAVSSNYPRIKRSKKEEYFLDPKTGRTHRFPSIKEPSSLNLTVIVPAYNEEDRLPPMLDECMQFLENRCHDSNFTYEIIVVSDGSTDKTVEVAHKYSEKFGIEKVRVLELEKNRGKGGAVRLGMLSARGALLLFADADGATKFEDLTKVEVAMKDIIKCDYLEDPSKSSTCMGISIGSRAHLELQSIAERSLCRTLLMRGFHWLVWLLAVKAVKDTQCGFKLMTRKTAEVLFECLHVERWAFDVELLYLAECLKIPVAEVAVNWTEIDGSKIVPVFSWIQMGIDLVLIWLRYTIGAWKIKGEAPKDE